MSICRRHRLASIAIVGLGACALMGHGACAAPPQNRLAAQLSQAAGSRTPASAAVRSPPSRLDLAAPAPAAPLLYGRPAAAAFAGATPRRAAEAAVAADMPGLGAAAPARVMSRPEMLVRNFKREGLPIAKLFQSENSLIHVGLSPKGKPGLWFVEKLH